MAVDLTKVLEFAKANPTVIRSGLDIVTREVDQDATVLTDLIGGIQWIGQTVGLCGGASESGRRHLCGRSSAPGRSSGSARAIARDVWSQRLTTEELVKQLEQRDRDLQSADALVYDFGRFTEEQTRLLAAGLVPNVIRSQALAMLSFDDKLERNAEKPLMAKATLRKKS